MSVVSQPQSEPSGVHHSNHVQNQSGRTGAQEGKMMQNTVVSTTQRVEDVPLEGVARVKTFAEVARAALARGSTDDDIVTFRKALHVEQAFKNLEDAVFRRSLEHLREVMWHPWSDELCYEPKSMEDPAFDWRPYLVQTKRYGPVDITRTWCVAWAHAVVTWFKNAQKYPKAEQKHTTKEVRQAQEIVTALEVYQTTKHQQRMNALENARKQRQNNHEYKIIRGGGGPKGKKPASKHTPKWLEKKGPIAEIEDEVNLANMQHAKNTKLVKAIANSKIEIVRVDDAKIRAHLVRQIPILTGVVWPTESGEEWERTYRRENAAIYHYENALYPGGNSGMCGFAAFCVANNIRVNNKNTEPCKDINTRTLSETQFRQLGKIDRKDWFSNEEIMNVAVHMQKNLCIVFGERSAPNDASQTHVAMMYHVAQGKEKEPMALITHPSIFEDDCLYVGNLSWMNNNARRILGLPRNVVEQFFNTKVDYKDTDRVTVLNTGSLKVGGGCAPDHWIGYCRRINSAEFQEFVHYLTKNGGEVTPVETQALCSTNVVTQPITTEETHDKKTVTYVQPTEKTEVKKSEMKVHELWNACGITPPTNMDIEGIPNSIGQNFPYLPLNGLTQYEDIYLEYKTRLIMNDVANVRVDLDDEIPQCDLVPYLMCGKKDEWTQYQTDPWDTLPLTAVAAMFTPSAPPAKTPPPPPPASGGAGAPLPFLAFTVTPWLHVMATPTLNDSVYGFSNKNISVAIKTVDRDWCMNVRTKDGVKTYKGSVPRHYWLMFQCDWWQVWAHMPTPTVLVRPFPDIFRSVTVGDLFDSCTFMIPQLSLKTLATTINRANVPKETTLNIVARVVKEECGYILEAPQVSEEIFVRLYEKLYSMTFMELYSYKTRNLLAPLVRDLIDRFHAVLQKRDLMQMFSIVFGLYTIWKNNRTYKLRLLACLLYFGIVQIPSWAKAFLSFIRVYVPVNQFDGEQVVGLALSNVAFYIDALTERGVAKCVDVCASGAAVMAVSVGTSPLNAPTTANHVKNLVFKGALAVFNGYSWWRKNINKYHNYTEEVVGVITTLSSLAFLFGSKYIDVISKLKTKKRRVDLTRRYTHHFALGAVGNNGALRSVTGGATCVFPGYIPPSMEFGRSNTRFKIRKFIDRTPLITNYVEHVNGGIRHIIGPSINTHTDSFGSNATIAQTGCIRMAKNFNVSLMQLPPHAAIVDKVREHLSDVCRHTRQRVRDADLWRDRLALLQDNGETIGFDRWGRDVRVTQLTLEWLEHMTTDKRRTNVLAIIKQVNNATLDLSVFKRRIAAKSFVKVEIAMRPVTKTFRPRMIQFLEPEIMIHLAPHAYHCYKLLKSELSSVERGFVNTAGLTPDALTNMVIQSMHKLRTNNSRMLKHNFVMFFNGDDNLCLVSKKMYESGKFHEMYTAWGRSPVIHQKASIYLANFCSGGFVPWITASGEVLPRFMSRPMKQLAKLNRFILKGDVSRQFKTNVMNGHTIDSDMLRAVIDTKLLSAYVNFSGCPLMQPIIETFFRLNGYSGTLENLQKRAVDYCLANPNPWKVSNSTTFYKSTTETDDLMWENYENLYSITRNEILSMQQDYIEQLKLSYANDLREIVWQNEVFTNMLTVDLDAKTPTNGGKMRSFDNDGDIYVIEADCSAYDATTNQDCHEQNLWFQKQCFGNSDFVRAIDWRKHIIVNAEDEYQSVSWVSRYQMLSGWYDTSIGNGITNMSEMLSSLIVSYPDYIV